MHIDRTCSMIHFLLRNFISLYRMYSVKPSITLIIPWSGLCYNHLTTLSFTIDSQPTAIFLTNSKVSQLAIIIIPTIGIFLVVMINYFNLFVWQCSLYVTFVTTSICTFKIILSLWTISNSGLVPIYTRMPRILSIHVTVEVLVPF